MTFLLDKNGKSLTNHMDDVWANKKMSSSLFYDAVRRKCRQKSIKKKMAITTATAVPQTHTNAYIHA